MSRRRAFRPDPRHERRREAGAPRVKHGAAVGGVSGSESVVSGSGTAARTAAARAYRAGVTARRRRCTLPSSRSRSCSAPGRAPVTASTRPSSRSATSRRSRSATSASRSSPTASAPPRPTTAGRSTPRPATGGRPAPAASSSSWPTRRASSRCSEGELDGLRASTLRSVLVGRTGTAKEVQGGRPDIDRGRRATCCATTVRDGGGRPAPHAPPGRRARPSVTRIALVTAEAARHLDQDLPPLEAALAGPGVERRRSPCGTTRPSTGPTFDLAVVRSTWDYAPPPRRARWRGPTASRRTAVGQPAAPCCAGAPTSATSSTWPRPACPSRRPSSSSPVTASTSAGRWPTASWWSSRRSAPAPSTPSGSRPTPRPAAARHLARLLAEGRAALVQPYLAARGRRRRDGAGVPRRRRFSHAVRKGPILRPDGTVFVEGLYAEEELDARDATDGPRSTVARAALAAVPNLDGVRRCSTPGSTSCRDPTARPSCSKLELAEPSLFLDLAPGCRRALRRRDRRRRGERHR